MKTEQHKRLKRKEKHFAFDSCKEVIIALILAKISFGGLASETLYARIKLTDKFYDGVSTRVSVIKTCFSINTF